jgi:hypothetical protein
MNWNLNRKRRKLKKIREKNAIRRGQPVFYTVQITRELLEKDAGFVNEYITDHSKHVLAPQISKQYRLPITYRSYERDPYQTRMYDTERFLLKFKVEWLN